MNPKVKTFLIDLLYDIIGSILYAAGIYTFARMADFAPGGISGIALILNYLWGLPIGIMTLIMNIPLVLISCKVVGKQFLIKTARSMIISTIFVDFIFPLTPAYTGNHLLAALYYGILMGAGLAFFYMRGSSSGGTDFLTMTLKVRHPHMSLGVLTMLIDLIVIMMGWPVFGNIDSVLYGLVSCFVASTVLDKIMYGTGAGKLIVIISDKGAEIASRINDMTGRGSTSIRAMGTYTRQDKDVLLCACSKSQTYSVTNAAHEMDPGAFVMVTETSEVFGEGFLNPDKH